MYCRDVKFLIDDYVAGRLDENQRSALESHIAGCQECTNLLNEEKEWLEMVRQATVPDPGEDYWRELDEKIMARTFTPEGEQLATESIPAISKRSKILTYMVPLAASLVLFLATLGLIGIAERPTTEIIVGADRGEYLNQINEKLCLDVRPQSEIIGSLLLCPPGTAGRHLAIHKVKSNL